MSADKPAGPKPADETAALRFLADAKKDCRLAADDDRPARDTWCLLIRGDGRKLHVGRNWLRGAVANGAVSAKGGWLSLSEEGRARLRRLLAGGAEAYAAQHRQMTSRADAGGEFMLVNDAESPLGALARLKRKGGEAWFPSPLVAAGDRLRADFTRGAYLPGMSARLEPVASRGSAARTGGIAELTDAALAARLRLERALEALGPELCGVVLDVCCYLKGLETVERERQWPPRSAKIMLRAGLERLARHYAPANGGRRQSHRWGGAGYRPDFEADLGSCAD